MAKKQELTPKTAAAAPARVAKPRVARVAAPRVSSATHKAVTPEITPATSLAPENRHEAISKIAYGYWIARGYQGGSPHEDWIRAEQAYLSR